MRFYNTLFDELKYFSNLFGYFWYLIILIKHFKSGTIFLLGRRGY